MTSNTEKSEQAMAPLAEKSTSSRRRRVGKKSKLPKAARLKTKLDPVEHCSVTRDMVLELREKFAQHVEMIRWLSNERGSHESRIVRLSGEVNELNKMKVVRAWPIYTAIVLEAAAIGYLGAKLFGYA